MKGTFSFVVEIGPSVVLKLGILAVLFALITVPAVFVTLPEQRHSFFKVGLVFGISVFLAGLIRLFGFEKAEIVQAGWYLIMPISLLPFFFMGFVGGGIWTVVGKKIFLSHRRKGREATRH